jgi:LmbE family N-acetylglucosaminyl deacetylase
LAIERLDVVGTVLYVAAHPDDENTRLLAWLGNARHLRTGYLSLTRGGGGQNLIGREQAELLGVVRTGELLAARALDGAEQRFTRARDFGYSKNPDESLRIWGHDAVLEDVVQVLRAFRPDVILTRFEPTGTNHGHHTASAMLAGEAFTAAADGARYPAQLSEGVTPWQADRLVHNQSHWRLQRMKNPDVSGFIKLDVGGFDPLTGRDYGEIAAASRSMHKSQGFGAAPERGPTVEYFSPVAGTTPKADLFEGLDLTWARYPGTEALRAALAKALRGFDPGQPEASLPALVAAKRELERAPLPAEGAHWRAIKRAEIDAIMVAAAGLFAEARGDRAAVVPGATLPTRLTLLNRSSAKLTLLGVRPVGAAMDGAVSGRPLPRHQIEALDVALRVPAAAPLSTPAWLREPPTEALYAAPPGLGGAAEGPPSLALEVRVEVGVEPLTLTLPVRYAWVDPVRGERQRDVEIAPPVTAAIDRRVVMFPTGLAQTVAVTLEAHADGQRGTLALEVPAGWTAAPASVPFTLAKAGDQQRVSVSLRAVKGDRPGRLRALVTTDAGFSGAWQRTAIDHEHLAQRSVLREASVPLVPVALTIAKGARRIAYVQGSGDDVATALRQVGYAVDELTPGELAKADLARFDTVMMGIRAYNTQPALYALHGRLMAWVAGGGRLVVQYNTNSWVQQITGPIGPFPFTVGRDRVTDETAAVTPARADHPLVTRPHQLVAGDYAGWVQERGLYFAEQWDPRYQAPLAMQDPGEGPLSGSVLVGKHGKGVFIYTGLSFFRQLPAGVPGAYRLLANMLAADGR